MSLSFNPLSVNTVTLKLIFGSLLMGSLAWALFCVIFLSPEELDTLLFNNTKEFVVLTAIAVAVYGIMLSILFIKKAEL